MRPTTIRRFVLAAVVVAVAAPPVCAQPGTNALREEVRAAWAKRQDAVRSLRAAWTTKTTTPKGALSFLPQRPGSKLPAVLPEQDTVIEGDAELLLDRDKSRLTMRGAWLDGKKGVFVRSQVVSVFDGKKFTYLKGPEQLGHPTAASKVADHNIFGDDMAVVPMFTATRGLNPSVARLTLEDYTQVRQVNEGSRRLVVVSRPRDETRGEASVWLDPAQDYVPVREENYNRDGKLTSKVVVVYSRPTGGVLCWLPERWTASGWVSGTLLNQIEVSVRHREVNVGTSPADFDLTLPAGTALSEEGNKRTEHSIIREDGTKRPILPSERDLSYDELVRTDPGPSPWGSRPWVWWVCGAGVVICAGSVALLLRRRPKSASGGVVPPSS